MLPPRCAAEALAAGRKPKLTKQQARPLCARTRAPLGPRCGSTAAGGRAVTDAAAQENAGKSPSAKKAEQKAARAAKAEASGTVRK